MDEKQIKANIRFFQTLDANEASKDLEDAVKDIKNIMDKNAKKELPSFLKNRKKVSEILNS
jgi:hypothetical protein